MAVLAARAGVSPGFVTLVFLWGLLVPVFGLFEDADLAAVCQGLRFASFANNSENCQAHTRILAPRSRYEEEDEDRKRRR